MIRETVLNVLPSDDDDRRLVIAIEQSGDGPSQLVLRQETRAAKVGWFVQSRVTVSPEQIAGLRSSLADRTTRAIQTPPAARAADPAAPEAIILSFREATSQVG
jgi:hypothetical protein